MANKQPNPSKQPNSQWQQDLTGTKNPPSPFKTWAEYYAAIGQNNVSDVSSDGTVEKNGSMQSQKKQASGKASPTPATQDLSLSQGDWQQHYLGVSGQPGNGGGRPIQTSPVAKPVDDIQSPVTEVPNEYLQILQGQFNQEIGGNGTAGGQPTTGNLQPTPQPQQTPQQAPYEVGSFRDVYKRMTGQEFAGGAFTKPEGMKSSDYQILMNLYNTEKKEEAARSAYDENLRQIAMSQSRDEQQAYILYEKMKRYLGMASQVAGGNGLNAGDAIKAANNYQNNLSAAAQEYEGMKRSASGAMNESIASARSTRDENLAKIYAEQDAAAESEADSLKAYESGLISARFDTMFDAAEYTADGKMTAASYAALEQFYNENKPNLDAVTDLYIKDLLKVDREITQQTGGSTQPGSTQPGSTPNTQISIPSVNKGYEFTYNGKTYVVESAVSDNYGSKTDAKVEVSGKGGYLTAGNKIWKIREK